MTNKRGGRALLLCTTCAVLQMALPDSAESGWRTTTWIQPRAIEVPAYMDDWFERAATPTTGGYGEAVVGTGSAIYGLRTRYATSTVYFWRYDPGVDEWTTLSNAGLDEGSFRNGTALAWDGSNNLYALAGARYSDLDRREFYRYSISGNSWTRLSDTPAPQGAGDALAWSGQEGQLYALLGSAVHGTVFARFDPVSHLWNDGLALPPEEIDDGCSLVWTGGGKLFALAGEYEETTPHGDFWSYDLSGDYWSTLADLPEPNGVGDGGSLLWLGAWLPGRYDQIYALGGGEVREAPGYGFYRYSIALDEWTRLEDLIYPVGDYNGTRFGYALGNIYCWQGAPSAFPGGGDRFSMYEF